MLKELTAVRNGYAIVANSQRTAQWIDEQDSDPDAAYHANQAAKGEKVVAALELAISLLSTEKKEGDLDITAKATRYLELHKNLGTLVDAIDEAIKDCHRSDMARLKPRQITVLRLVAGAVALAGHYGYTVNDILRLWEEWEHGNNYLYVCMRCGTEHAPEPGCPPQEPRAPVQIIDVSKGGNPG